MTFQASALINYVYCIVARSRLTDVATTESVEWETLIRVTHGLRTAVKQLVWLHILPPDVPHCN